jgi:hypothetical protein
MLLEEKGLDDGKGTRFFLMVKQQTPSLAMNKFNANRTRLPAVQKEGDGKIELVFVMV